MKKLPFSSQSYESIYKNSIDSIMISPRSRGKLRVGEFTKDRKPPKHGVKISATNIDLVNYHEVKMGNEDHYFFTYDVENRNDSPAFADIVLE